MKRTLAILFLLASVTPYAVQAQWLTLKNREFRARPTANRISPRPRRVQLTAMPS